MNTIEYIQDSYNQNKYTCPNCGRPMDEVRAYAEGELVETGYSCPDCEVSLC